MQGPTSRGWNAGTRNVNSGPLRRQARAFRTHGLPLVLVWLLIGCATGPARVAEQAPAPQPAAQPPQPVVRDPATRLGERVAQYWDARVRGDLLETYAVHEPAFRRAVTLTAFLQGRGSVPITEYAVLNEQIEGRLAYVKMKVKSGLNHQAATKPVEPRWVEFHEQWVWVEGDWYRKYRFPVGDPYPAAVDWDDIAARRRPPGQLQGR